MLSTNARDSRHRNWSCKKNVKVLDNFFFIFQLTTTRLNSTWRCLSRRFFSLTLAYSLLLLPSTSSQFTSLMSYLRRFLSSRKQNIEIEEVWWIFEKNSRRVTMRNFWILWQTPTQFASFSLALKMHFILVTFSFAWNHRTSTAHKSWENHFVVWILIWHVLRSESEIEWNFIVCCGFESRKVVFLTPQKSSQSTKLWLCSNLYMSSKMF